MLAIERNKENKRSAVFGLSLPGILFYISLFSVLFMPRFMGQIRYEDLLIPFLLVLSASGLKYYEKNIDIVLLWIAYLFYSMIITLVNIIFFDLNYLAILVWGKEVQYLLLFLVSMQYFTGYDAYSNFQKFIFLVLCVVFVYVVSYLFTNQRSDYGLPYINDKSPTNSMLVYFHLYVLALLIHKNIKSDVYFLFLAVVMFFLVMLVGNRTGQLGLVVFLFVYLLMALSPLQSFMLGGGSILLLLIVVRYHQELYEVFYYNDFQHPVLLAALSRFGTLFTLFETYEASRISSVVSILSITNENSLLFGCGRGCTHVGLDDSFSLGMGGDNQYSVNIAEIGVVGFLLHNILFLAPFLYSAARKSKVFVSYAATFFVMAFTAESFQLPRGAQFFWIITAIVLMQGKGIARQR